MELSTETSVGSLRASVPEPAKVAVNSWLVAARAGGERRSAPIPTATTLAAADTARCRVLGRPHSPAVGHTCVLARLAPAQAIAAPLIGESPLLATKGIEEGAAEREAAQSAVPAASVPESRYEARVAETHTRRMRRKRITSTAAVAVLLIVVGIRLTDALAVFL